MTIGMTLLRFQKLSYYPIGTAPIKPAEETIYSQDLQPQAGHDQVADQTCPGLCLPPLLLRVPLQVLPPPRG